MSAPAGDPASVANTSSFLVDSSHFDWNLDFVKRELAGSATLRINRVPGTECSTMYLDVHEMQIKGVEAESHACTFNVESAFSFGSKLVIELPAGIGSSFNVKIDYVCGGGPAMVWLEPAMTKGGKHPYLFTQGQACLNRSMFPCQDSPGVKSTFSASVTVPEGLTVVMSAQHDTPTGEAAEGGLRRFRFTMPQRIPSYLVAMAAGNIVGQEVGPRSTVYTEPELLDASVAEFGGVIEQYVAAGERLFGKYEWDRYDVLVMPPCFPFGGMENPRLTFVTPCLITGDGSLTDVVAHEIAHSWFGNLVTNANWSHFWLNEGFTMYAQREITTAVHGKEFTELEAVTGRKLLRECVNDFGADSPLTRLDVPIAEGVDPEDTYNETPYEKGYACVKFLQSIVGGEAPFQEWLRSYCSTFKFKSIVSTDMFDHFCAHFPHAKEAQEWKQDGLSWDDWLNNPGMPKWLPDLSAAESLSRPVDDLVDTFLETPSFTAENAAMFAGWTPYQRFHMLDRLHAAGPLSFQHCSEMDSKLGLSQSSNSEILLRWGQIILQASYEPGFSCVRKFLLQQGKQKYTLPLYREAVKDRENNQKRIQYMQQVYEDSKNALHPLVSNYSNQILNADG